MHTFLIIQKAPSPVPSDTTCKSKTRLIDGDFNMRYWISQCCPSCVLNTSLQTYTLSSSVVNNLLFCHTLLFVASERKRWTARQHTDGTYGGSDCCAAARNARALTS
eukprot:2712071-Pyramimonas_sp.AAC.1